MPKQNNQKPFDIELREKLLDIEQSTIKLEAINNLLIAYAGEHSPEASILADLFTIELNKISQILNL